MPKDQITEGKIRDCYYDGFVNGIHIREIYDTKGQIVYVEKGGVWYWRKTSERNNLKPADTVLQSYIQQLLETLADEGIIKRGIDGNNDN